MNYMKSKQVKIKVYFDGLCKVCSIEIEHYQKQVGAENLDFINICSNHFDAVKEDVNPIDVHKIMHVRRADGSLAIKVDAFIEIWNALPKYKRLARLAEIRILRRALDAGYSFFTVVRPWLPRKKASDDCSESPYCEVKNA